MPYNVLFTKKAVEDIEKIDTSVKKQIYKKLIYSKDLDDIKIVAKKLHNYEAGEYRLRVGNFRIIFDLDKHIIVVFRIQHRKDVYK